MLVAFLIPLSQLATSVFVVSAPNRQPKPQSQSQLALLLTCGSLRASGNVCLFASATALAIKAVALVSCVSVCHSFCRKKQKPTPALHFYIAANRLRSSVSFCSTLAQLAGGSLKLVRCLQPVPMKNRDSLHPPSSRKKHGGQRLPNIN